MNRNDPADSYRMGDAGTGAPMGGGMDSTQASSHGSPARSTVPAAAVPNEVPPPGGTTPPEVSPILNTEYLMTYHFGTRLLKWILAMIAVIVIADGEHLLRYLGAKYLDAYNLAPVSYLEFCYSMVLIIETFLIVMYVTNLIAKIPLFVRQYLVLVLTAGLFLFLFIGTIVSSHTGVFTISYKNDSGTYRHFPAATTFCMMLTVAYAMDHLYIYSWFRTGREYAPWPCLTARHT